MDNQRRKLDGSATEVQMIIGDIGSEINLDGSEILKLESRQSGARVTCTTGTLWLTQQGDPYDHFLKAGQSYTLKQYGLVLVQGLPQGKALIHQ